MVETTSTARSGASGATPAPRAANDDVARPKRERFAATWFDEIEENQTKDWIIESVFGAGEFTYVVGKPGHGKSVIVGDAACHVAAGMDWHERKVKQGLVVYIAAERALLTKRRMLAFRQEHNIIGKIPLAIISEKPDFTRSLADARELIARIRSLSDQCGFPPTWIIDDTLSRSFGGGDQNSSQDMNRYIDSMLEIKDRTGAHVTAVHHTPWGDDRAKGAIDLDGAVDASFLVTKSKARGKDVFRLRCDGTNDGEEGLITAFTLKSVAVGKDKEGKETTAPVVAPDDSALGEDELSDGAPIILKTSTKRKVVKTFERALAEAGQVSPSGRLAVHDSELRKRIAEDFDGPKVQATSLPAIVRRELKSLLTKEDAEQIGEWFYVHPAKRPANDNADD